MVSKAVKCYEDYFYLYRVSQYPWNINVTICAQNERESQEWFPDFCFGSLNTVIVSLKHIKWWEQLDIIGDGESHFRYVLQSAWWLSI